MKIYKCGDESFFEVIEEELLENSNGYKIKVNRYISPKSPDFKFKEESYFIISIGAWHRRLEITEDDFVNSLDHFVKVSWREIFETEKKSNDGVFSLTPLAVSSRNSYKKTYNLDHVGFLNATWELRKEVMGGP